MSVAIILPTSTAVISSTSTIGRKRKVNFEPIVDEKDEIDEKLVGFKRLHINNREPVLLYIRHPNSEDQFCFSVASNCNNYNHDAEYEIYNFLQEQGRQVSVEKFVLRFVDQIAEVRCGCCLLQTILLNRFDLFEKLWASYITHLPDNLSNLPFDRLDSVINTAMIFTCLKWAYFLGRRDFLDAMLTRLGSTFLSCCSHPIFAGHLYFTSHMDLDYYLKPHPAKLSEILIVHVQFAINRVLAMTQSQNSSSKNTHQLMRHFVNLSAILYPGSSLGLFFVAEWLQLAALCIRRKMPFMKHHTALLHNFQVMKDPHILTLDEEKLHNFILSGVQSEQKNIISNTVEHKHLDQKHNKSVILEQLSFTPAVQMWYKSVNNHPPSSSSSLSSSPLSQFSWHEAISQTTLPDCVPIFSETNISFQTRITSTRNSLKMMTTRESLFEVAYYFAYTYKAYSALLTIAESVSLGQNTEARHTCGKDIWICILLMCIFRGIFGYLGSAFALNEINQFRKIRMLEESLNVVDVDVDEIEGQTQREPQQPQHVEGHPDFESVEVDTHNHHNHNHNHNQNSNQFFTNPNNHHYRFRYLYICVHLVSIWALVIYFNFDSDLNAECKRFFESEYRSLWQLIIVETMSFFVFVAYCVFLLFIATCT